MGGIGLDRKTANALKWGGVGFMVSKVYEVSDFVGMKDVNVSRIPCILVRLWGVIEAFIVIFC